MPKDAQDTINKQYILILVDGILCILRHHDREFLILGWLCDEHWHFCECYFHGRWCDQPSIQVASIPTIRPKLSCRCPYSSAWSNGVLVVLSVRNPRHCRIPGHDLRERGQKSCCQGDASSLASQEYALLSVKQYRWGQFKDLPKMGALALVQNGDDVLTNLDRGTAKYADLIREVVIAKQLLMVNPSYLIMSRWRCYAITKWCLALRSVLSTSGIWPI